MGPPLFASVLSSKFQVPKKTLKMKQMLMAFLAVSALSLATSAPAPFKDPTAEMILSDEEVAQYAGIIDLIPGVANVIQQLVPVMQEQATILIDPNMDFNTKVGEMMKVCVQHAPEIVQVVGDFG